MMRELIRTFEAQLEDARGELESTRTWEDHLRCQGRVQALRSILSVLLTYCQKSDT